jgi:hypothetical protein
MRSAPNAMRRVSSPAPGACFGLDMLSDTLDPPNPRRILNQQGYSSNAALRTACRLVTRRPCR